MAQVPLASFCQARSGDKGNTVNVAVFAPDDRHYRVLCDQLTAERVKAHFAGWVQGAVERYRADNLWALNFVCREALNGGGSRSIRLDNLGKCFASNILRVTVEIPDQAGDE
ncbi:MAG: hypothetical protein M0Z53_00210 [Thermaerobacter sp.]|nr:hypothetical protein [Thermaerobacter sp.]